MSAFSAYAASQWSSSESEQYNKADAALIESTELSDKANTEIALDVEMLSNYVNASMQGNTALAQLYMTDAFSDSLKAAYAACVFGKETLSELVISDCDPDQLRWFLGDKFFGAYRLDPTGVAAMVIIDFVFHLLAG